MDSISNGEQMIQNVITMPSVTFEEIEDEECLDPSRLCFFIELLNLESFLGELWIWASSASARIWVNWTMKRSQVDTFCSMPCSLSSRLVDSTGSGSKFEY